MHDLRLIRDDPDGFDAALARRGADPAAAAVLALDEERRTLTTRLQHAQTRRNEASKAIGAAMAKGDADTAEALKAEVGEIKRSMPDLEEQERAAAKALEDALAVIPNLPANDVPDGADESDNIEVATWGEKPEFDFEPREHADIAPALGMDFETGTKLSGARFTFLRGQMARLHRALGQFMIDRQLQQHGYTECAPPLLVRDEAMFGTDKLPKFAEDSFHTSRLAFHVSAATSRMVCQSETPHPKRQLAIRLFRKLRSSGRKRERKIWQTNSAWLIPTAEVSLTASVMGDILDDAALPLRLTALTPVSGPRRGRRGRIRAASFASISSRNASWSASCGPKTAKPSTSA